LRGEKKSFCFRQSFFPNNGDNQGRQATFGENRGRIPPGNREFLRLISASPQKRGDILIKVLLLVPELAREPGE